MASNVNCYGPEKELENSIKQNLLRPPEGRELEGVTVQGGTSIKKPSRVWQKSTSFLSVGRAVGLSSLLFFGCDL